MSKITKVQTIPPEVVAEFAKAERQPWSPGTWLIDRYGRLYRIVRYERDKYATGLPEDQRPWVAILRSGNLDPEAEDDGEEAGRLSRDTLRDLLTYEYVEVKEDIATLHETAMAAFMQGGWQALAETTSDTVALAQTSDRLAIENVRDAIRERKRRADVIERIVKARLSSLQSYASQLKDQLEYVGKIVAILELYLGVYEQLVQVADGPRAAPDSPTHFFQRVLYMDEEVGIYETLASGQAGIDFQTIEEFDKWLVSDVAHLNAICPTEKGVVALKPSRQERHYSPDFWVQIHMKANNEMLYLLVRNGLSVWRVYTSIKIGETLFPTAAQAATFTEDTWGDSKEKTLNHKTIAMLLQGLIDRTEMLQPWIKHINLLDPAAYDQGHFVLVRDAEAALPEGHKPWRQWKEDINKHMQVGSRIALGNMYHSYDKENYFMKERLTHYVSYTFPPEPRPGIYTLVREWHEKPYYAAGEKHGFSFTYNPKDRVYDSSWSAYNDWEEHERKRGIGFKVWANDPFVLAYDQVDLADIEFYLTSRYDRRDYLDMLPVLAQLRQYRLQELAHERGFVELLAQKEGLDEAAIWQAIKWWKFKTKTKRPIAQDDAKAWRMIRRYMAGGLREAAQPLEEAESDVALDASAATL